MPSQRSSSMEAQDNTRKRVGKACDRCHLKKSKCDEESPCSRCKADNSICVLDQRKRSQDKVYPKGYVEILEQQQAQLVAGLRDLYARLQTGQASPGQLLREVQGGHPMTHKNLERLDVLHVSSENGSSYKGFEEDCSRLQHKLHERGAPLWRRHGPTSSDSKHGHAQSSSSYSGNSTTRHFAFTNPFARTLPSLPMHSPSSRQSQTTAPLEQEPPTVSSTFMQTGALDPSALSRAWMGDSMMIEEPIDLSKSVHEFDNFNNFDQVTMVDPIYMDPNDPMMPDWNNTTELDFNNFIQNPIGV